MRLTVLLSAVLLLAACQAPGRGGPPPAPLTGAPEQQAEAQAIAIAQKATTLHDANAGRLNGTNQTAEPADHSNLAEIREQIARDHASFSEGRWMARQLEGDTWQVIYAYKLNNLDYSYRFVVNIATRKVTLS